MTPADVGTAPYDPANDRERPRHGADPTSGAPA